MASVHVQKATAWVNHQVEKEGIARLTIIILLLTTVAMLAFTWGYAEGVYNIQSEMAEQMRLNADTRRPSISEHSLPSIADLRSRSQQQQDVEFNSLSTRTVDVDERLPQTHASSTAPEVSMDMHETLGSTTESHVDAAGSEARRDGKAAGDDDSINFDDASSDVRQDISMAPRPQGADEDSSVTEEVRPNRLRDYSAASDDYAG